MSGEAYLKSLSVFLDSFDHNTLVSSPQHGAEDTRGGEVNETTPPQKTDTGEVGFAPKSFPNPLKILGGVKSFVTSFLGDHDQYMRFLEEGPVNDISEIMSKKGYTRAEDINALIVKYQTEKNANTGKKGMYDEAILFLSMFLAQIQEFGTKDGKSMKISPKTWNTVKDLFLKCVKNGPTSECVVKDTVIRHLSHKASEERRQPIKNTKEILSDAALREESTEALFGKLCISVEREFLKTRSRKKATMEILTEIDSKIKQFMEAPGAIKEKFELKKLTILKPIWSMLKDACDRDLEEEEWNMLAKCLLKIELDKNSK